jgi:lipopolysaccharide/colanic/teichoic acid biosynthesis glycosyltransferase
MGRIAVNENKKDAIAALEQLPEITGTIQVREIIFCAGYLSYQGIIQHLQHLPSHIKARFHAANTSSIVGSDSKEEKGEYLGVEGTFELNDPMQKRRKRIVDLTISFTILLTIPVHLLVFGEGILSNTFGVIFGKNTWIGYSESSLKLPGLRPGILTTNGVPISRSAQFTKESQHKIDEWYARNYHWLHDIKLVIKNYKWLGSNYRT